MITRRRRLAKLKLTHLPSQRQLDLARQLSFYIELSELLARFGFVRPNTQNPRDFALALRTAHGPGMEPVLALTDLFYRVRFGGLTLDTPQRQRVRVYLRQLQRALAGPNTDDLAR